MYEVARNQKFLLVVFHAATFLGRKMNINFEIFFLKLSIFFTDFKKMCQINRDPSLSKSK